ncbi:MAG TPA: 30S ribosome-binding factor RbfA [Flavobacteriales bacterium]
MAGIRLEKVGSLIKRELSIIFQQNTNTLFDGMMITVTQVRVSPDLSIAKVYLSFFPSEKKEAGLELVKGKDFQIKKLLTAEVGKQLRKVPVLHYYIDDSLDYYEEIERLLKK